MSTSRFMQEIRRLFSVRKSAAVKRKRLLRLVHLEDRRVLNGTIGLQGIALTGSETLTISDGGLQDLGGGANVQSVSLTLSSGTWGTPPGAFNADEFELSAGNTVLTIAASLLNDGGDPLSAGDVLEINGDDAATQQVILDLSGVDFIPTGGIRFVGGEGAGDNDSLAITGYDVTTLELTHEGAENGQIEFAGLGTVEFDEIEPLALDGTADDLIINLPAGADPTVVLSDDTGAVANVSQISGAFETTTFVNPTSTLTINDGTGVKSISVQGLDADFDADLILAEDDATPDNVVTFETADTDLDSGALDIEALTININRTISTTGNVLMTAQGAITDGNAGVTNISANNAILIARTGIGSADALETSLTLLDARNDVSGDINIIESSGLTLSGARTLAGNGIVDISVLAGDLETTGLVSANGSGNVLLDAAAGAVTLGDNVLSGTGDISITGDSVTQNANITTAGAGAVSVVADNGSITMTGTATTTTNTGSITYSATLDAALILLTSTSGNIFVTADSDTNGTGAISDETVAETANIVTTGRASLSAGAGIGDTGPADINTTIGRLEAVNSTTGNIFVLESNGLTIDLTGVQTLGGNGEISIIAAAGTLAIDAAVAADGSGSVTLIADAGTTTIDDLVSSVTGNIEIEGTDVAQSANITTAGAGTISVTASSGSIAMVDGTVTTAAAGLIAYAATVNIALSLLRSTNGNMSVTADSNTDGTGAILDLTVLENANLVTTGQVTLSAAEGIGAAAAADIDTTIGNLVATNSTSGGIFIEETSGLVIDGTGVRTLGGNGSINIDVNAGSLTVNSVVTADGSGLVTLNADAGNITTQDTVSSGTGDILITADAVDQDGDISSGGAGTVTVTADTGSITMGDGSATTTNTGLITYTARTDVALSVLSSTSGNVVVTADSDVNGSGAISDNTVGEASNIVTGGALVSLRAATGIGGSGAADIDTTIVTIDAQNSTTGDFFIQETNGLIIGGVGIQTIAGSGNISVLATAGNLTVNSIVTANGSGDVTLIAGAGTLSLAAGVSSSLGDLVLQGDVVLQNVNISTAGTGTISVAADDGSITMSDGTSAATGSGIITYSAAVSVALSLLTSTSGNLIVVADSDSNGTGSVLDNTALEDALLVTSGSATLNAAQGVGAAGAGDIDTAIGTLIASNTTSGIINVTELTVGGNIALGSVSNGNRDVTIVAESGAITDGNAAAVNLTAGTVVLFATNGIGSGNALETNIGRIEATNTLAGNIEITEVVAGGDLILGAVSNLLRDVFISTEDGSMTDGNAGAVNISANNATLDAVGGSIGSTSADVFKGDFDPIEVLLTNDLTANATDAVAFEGTIGGTTTLNATTGFLQSNGDLDVSGQVFSFTNLGLIADADNNGTGVLTLGPSLAVVGDLRLQGASIVASDATIDLSARRILFVSGADADINVTTSDPVTVPTLTLDATAFGDLTVNSDRSVDLVDVNCDNVALQTTSSAGDISLILGGGTLTVRDDVIAGNDGLETSTGNVVLAALGVSGDVIIQDTVLADNDLILIVANNDIRIEVVAGDLDDIDNDGNLDPVDIDGDLTPDADNLAVITTVSGDILVIADFNGDANGSGGLLTMADGSRIVAGRNDLVSYVPGTNGVASPSVISLGATAFLLSEAEVTLSSDEDLTLSSVQTTNAGALAVRITSVSGAIVDGGDTDVDIVADFAGALTTLRADTGIGDLNQIEVNIATLNAINTVSGTIRISELNSVALDTLNNATRDVFLTATDSITDGGDARIDVVAGLATLQAANGIGDVNAIETTVTTLNVVNTTANTIRIAETDDVGLDTVNNGIRDVFLTAGGAITDGGDTNIDVVAGLAALQAASGIGDADAIETTVTTLNVVNTTSGIVRIAETDSVALDTINNSGRNVFLTATDAITDGGDGNVDVVAGLATLQAANGIGDANAIETTVASLNVVNTASGTIRIVESDSVALDTINNGTREIALTATFAILDGGDANIDVVAGLATLQAAFGIGAADAIETTVTLLSVTNTAFNAVRINETDSVALDTINNGTRDIFLTASGAITDGGDGNVDVVAGLATLVAATGIGDTNAIETAVTTLNAVNNTTGAIRINETDVVALDTIDNGTREVFLSAGDAITDGGDANVDVVAGLATLAARNGIGDSDSIETTVTTLTAVNTIANTIRINETDSVALDTIDNASRDVLLFAGDAITDGGDVNVDVVAGTATLIAFNGIGDANAIETTVTTLVVFNLTSNGIQIVETDSVALDTVNNGTRDVFLAVGDAITDGGDVRVDVVAGLATLLSVNGIGDANAIETTVTTLNAVNTTANTIRIVETDSVALDTINNATRDVFLTAGDAITDGGDVNTDIIAGLATLQAASGIGDADALEITVTTLNVVNTATNVIRLSETDSVALDTINNGSRDVFLSANAAITDGGDVNVDVVARLATLAAVTGIGDGNAIETTVTALNAVNSSSGTIRIVETDSVALDTVNNDTRDVFLSAGSAVTDGGDVLVDVVAGLLTLQAVNGIGETDAIETTVTTLNVVNTATQAVRIAETDSVALDTINNGTRDVSLSAGGAITDGGDVNVDLVAGLTTLQAVTGIGSGNALETTVTTIDAANSTSGTLEIIETDGIQVQQLLQGQDDSISLVAGGDISVIGLGVAIDDSTATSGNADILLRSLSGDISIAGTVRNDSNNADATILLDAIGPDSDVVVFAPVITEEGGITITADDSIGFATNGDITANGAGNVVVTANRLDGVGNDGNIILMLDGAVINAGSGTITMTSTGINGGNITVEDLITTGNLISITSTQDISIGTVTNGGTLRATDADGTADLAALSGETISLVAGGDILIGSGSIISTDDTPQGVSDAGAAGDSVLITADGGNGRITFGNLISIRTDGGVAQRFAPRPEQNVFGSAFLPPSALIIGAVVIPVGIHFEITFTTTIGMVGEENLRLDIDWRDPDLGPGDLNGERIESIFRNGGVQSVSHTYSFFDLQAFVAAGNPIFQVDFSVSHHQSIQIFAGIVDQGGAINVPIPPDQQLVTSSDDTSTGTEGPFPPSPPGVDRTVATVVDDVLSNADFHFEGGRVEVLIPTLFLPPIEPNPETPSPLPVPVAVAQPPVPLPVLVAAAEPAEFPNSSYSTQSQDYFQLRRFDGVTRRVEAGYEHIDDDFGELLLQPRRLKQWVAEKHFQDGLGYELWLITEKVNKTGGRVTVERPVLKFDVSNEQPFPSAEGIPDIFPELRLEPMPLEEGEGEELPDQSSISEPTGEGAIQSMTTGFSSNPENESRETEKSDAAEDGSTRGPDFPETDDSVSDTESDGDAISDGSFSATSQERVAFAGLAASLLVTRVRTPPSKSVGGTVMLGRILNRRH